MIRSEDENENMNHFLHNENMSPKKGYFLEVKLSLQ